ncbi:AAA family ATPase [Methylobacterium sp. J-067]|uniref:AAA family ATPase n=1 Tax=Methylobacterium sp. J-067 TaxID=2836648 RepID=UPI001FBA631A|nr:AAA family ATPase [Methylobacterium sp. J-067]MCJ2023248.1 AAA family ATPase [Methylobacterium sp. J-067]
MSPTPDPAWQRLCLHASLSGDLTPIRIGDSPFIEMFALTVHRLAAWYGDTDSEVHIAWTGIQTTCLGVRDELYRDPILARIAYEQTSTAFDNAIRRLTEIDGGDGGDILDFACSQADAAEWEAIADATAMALMECGSQPHLDYVATRAAELRRMRPDGHRFDAAVLGLSAFPMPMRLAGQGAIGVLAEALANGGAQPAAPAGTRRSPAISSIAPRGPVHDDTGSVPEDVDEGDVIPGSPVVTAAGRQLLRTLNGVAGLRQDIDVGGIVVLVDVPDRLTLAALDSISFHSLGLHNVRRIIHTDPPKGNSDKERRPKEFLSALRAPAALVCLTPDAGTCLPPAALQAAVHRLTLSPIDAGDLSTVIRAETGQPLSASERAAVAGLSVTAEHLAIAVRPGRLPKAIIADLARLTAPPKASGRGRDLTLDDLHGARKAVEWCRSTMRDLEGWRAGAPWSTVSNGAVFHGPPGTGKTLGVQAFAASAGIPLVIASLPLWQSLDAGHLGTTLRGMRGSFDEARVKAAGRRGAILLVDECETFVDRRTVRHDHSDYVIQVTNSFLECLDGAGGREGVIVIGTTNDLGRIDPAILRPGRLGVHIEIGLPDVEERVEMIRVRLAGDLPGADLLPVAWRTERYTGAMIEALVEDARRRARHADRSLTLDDLLTVAGAGDEGVPAEALDRYAVHEAGHALLATLEEPCDDLVVAIQAGDGMAGWVKLGAAARGVWTRTQAETRIRLLLAGRAAEDMLLDSVSSGASHDLAQATKMVVEMVGEWGLGSRGLVAVSLDPATALTTAPLLRREVQETLDRLYAGTRETVRRHAGAVRRIADALVEQRRLDGAQVARLVAEASPSRRHCH